MLSQASLTYWSTQEKRLKGDSMIAKAQKFHKKGCVIHAGNHWLIKPIHGYNTTTYTVRGWDKNLTCNCQGFHKNGDCSHVWAVRLWGMRRGWW